MEIVIIEDEKITAEDLKLTIQTVMPDCKISAILSSVKSAIEYFEKETSPDLIFSDIQLGDGLSFDIFKAVDINAPVIFCTAYDEYALEAFQTNSIDYILKPFSSDSVEDAIEKYRQLKKTFASEKQDYNALIEALLHKNKAKTASILVHYKDKIKPVKMDDIAIFFIENEIVSLITLEGKKYHLNKTLEELGNITGDIFFRANRQCLLNKKAVLDVSQYFSNKLSVNISVPFEEKIIVSKAKKTMFLEWLEKD